MILDRYVYIIITNATYLSYTLNAWYFIKTKSDELKNKELR